MFVLGDNGKQILSGFLLTTSSAFEQRYGLNWSVPEFMTSAQTHRPIYVYVRPLINIITKKMLLITPRLVCLLSVLTNGISLIIFIRMTRKKQNSAMIFIVISVVDTLSLIGQFDLVIKYGAPRRSLLKHNVICKLLNWIQGASQDCSAYMSLLYTLERFISVRFPLQRAVICTRRRIVIAIVATVSCSLIIEFYHFMLSI